MSYSDLLYCIALTMLQDIGSITAKKLIAYTGSPRAVFSEKNSALLKIPGIGNHLIQRIRSLQVMTDAEREFEYIKKHNIQALYFLDDKYPERLKHCIDGPVLCYLKGESCLSRSKVLSVVGTRQATNYGREVCREIIQNLASKYKCLVIVSGLAYGIDITAHHAALSNQIKTVAVLGHGLNTIYPNVHRNTAIRIIGQGALLTDFTSGTKPEKNNFIRRNRIIAGLSDATLIIESGKKGGALITADIASSYDREVLAIPGRANDKRSEGCNRMIKKNIAALVENSEDIEYLLNWESESRSESRLKVLKDPLSAEEQKIIDIMHNNPGLLPEAIAINTGMPIHQVVSRLVEMELRGWMYMEPGNIYHLKIKPA